MKRNLFLLVAAVAALASSCSKNEIFNEQEASDSQTIGFVPYAHLSITKGTPIADNSGFQSGGYGFGVAAFFNGTTSNTSAYMGTATAGAEFTYASSWNYKNTTDIRYWPTEALDFIAYAPFADNNATRTFAFSQNGTATSATVEYTVAANNADQKDFMVDYQQNKTTIDLAAKKLPLSFKHALTQIAFKLANESSNLNVEVSEIIIKNANSKGSYNFAADSWGSHTTPVNYTFTPSSAVVMDGTTVSTDMTSANGNLMLLPQTGGTAWDKTTVGYATGQSIVIKCRISEKANGTYLWATNSTYEDLAIPVAFNWEKGKKVNYAITFGKTDGTAGGAGYDPTQTDTPVLLPILFTSSVEAWSAVADTAIDM